MRIKIGFLLIAIVFSSSAWTAEKAQPKRKAEAQTAVTASSYQFLLAVGSEYRPERDVERNYAQHYYSNYAVGIAKGRLAVIFEKADFKEVSGNPTLNLERKFQDYLLWGQYSVFAQGFLNAYGGLGLGAYQETVTTNFLGQSTTNSAKYKFMGGGSIGARANLSVFFVALEARMLFGDELDQQPTFGGVARLGLWF